MTHERHGSRTGVKRPTTCERGRYTRLSRRIVPGALVVLIILAYTPTFRASFVNWDDTTHVYENPYITEPDRYADAWRDWRDPSFYPLTFTGFWMEWRATDGAAWLFHVDNVLLHAANAVAAGLLGRALGVGSGAAWAAAGLWALHPVQVGSVAWITERKNVLFVFFSLTALLAYARAIDDTAEDTASRAGAFWLLSLGLTCAALLSKATAVTLPVLVVLLHWTRGRAFDRRCLMRLVPYVAIALIAAALHLVRENVSPPIGLGTRLLIASRSVWFYVARFVWPADLAAMYPRWSTENALDWGLPAVGALVAVAIGLMLLRTWLPRPAWFALGHYTVNIGLVVGVAWFPYMYRSFVADHLMYFPSLGLAWLVVLAATRVLPRVAVRPGLGRAATASTWLVFAFLSFQHASTWRDSETLWTHALRHHPECGTCHANLGMLYADRGDLATAVRHYQRALRARPNVKTAVNFGNARRAQGRYAEAAKLYEMARRLDPAHAGAAYNLGNVLHLQGRTDEAIERYREALRLAPHRVEIHNNLGAALLDVGRREEAQRAFEDVLRLDPDDVEAGLNLGVIASQREEWTVAVAHYEHALRHHGDDPRYAAAHAMLAESLAELGRLDDAIARYEIAVRLDPDAIDNLTGLAAMQARRGRYDVAARTARRALAAAAGDPRRAAEIRQQIATYEREGR